jgi:hypothetical protein
MIPILLPQVLYNFQAFGLYKLGTGYGNLDLDDEKVTGTDVMNPDPRR